MKEIRKRIFSLLLAAVLVLAMLPLPARAAGLVEQFSLTPGGTYYFDLSDQDIPGLMVNSSLPDISLKWVPFTYVGTINAYSIDALGMAPSSGRSGDRSLFVADYNVTLAPSWGVLQTAGLIFGKNYSRNGVLYNLRALSVGNERSSAISGAPANNEWDQIKNKNENYLKNWNAKWSWGQEIDLLFSDNSAVRGNFDVGVWASFSRNNLNDPSIGFRPVLEIMNVGALGRNGLKTVTYDMGSNGTLGNGQLTSATVVYSGTLTLPQITPQNGFQFTAPQQSAALGWFDGIGFRTGGSPVPNLPTGTIFTACYNPYPFITTESLPDGTENTSYSYTLTADGQTPITWSMLNDLPEGLSLNQDTGVISGTPVQSGTTNLDVKATNALGNNIQTHTLTIKPDPNIAVVAAAKTAVENAAYPATTQAAHGTESVVKGYVENRVKAAVNNSDVTVTVDKVSYAPPAAGDAESPIGSDGSYIFTVTVAKGSQSQTTAQKTIAITATPFTGVTHVQAVAAAKVALVDGSVDVPFGASQTDKTAAVQSYVNGLLTGDAAGVTAAVFYNSGTGNYDVALSKGSASDSKTLAMTVNESADPDIAIVGTAKAAADNAAYPGITQAEYSNEAGVKSYVEDLVEAAVNNNDVAVTVTKAGFTAPIAGDADNPQGTDGSYTFTVTVAKGSQNQTTALKAIVITATPFTGLSNAQAVAAAKAALVDGSVDVPFGASQTDKAAAVQSYVNGLLTGDAAGVTAVVSYNSGTDNYDVALSKGSASDSKTLAMTVNESADPDIAIVVEAKTAAEGASYSTMTQEEATSESVIETALKAIAEAAVKNGNVAVTINKVSYTSPIAGTSANRSGTDGSYVFTITVTKGAQSQTTGQIKVNISATVDTSRGTPGGGTPGGGGTPSGGGTPGSGIPGGSTPSSGTPRGGTPGGGTPGGSTPSSGTPVSGSSFADVDKKDWFFDAVAYVRQNGLMSGISETTFSPHLTANRAMIVTVLYRMAGNPHVTGENTFTDVPSGTWYTDAIKWATQNGIVSGYGNNSFGIDDAVTREQLVALLYRYAQYKNLDITATGDLSGFADKDKISAWATDAMKWAVGKGLISGKGNGNLDPSGTATRAEIAAILMRFLIQ
ncbi:S-layer homology domain-containing protein [Cohnella terricola]|uniref:SLH domain-containing protein n=1 Tax=Cohnella terricola TaxID=1289167 RepID=A0A559JGN7_9BACL|nr:S-layer homology domain-containing protein [Cohnella terricola]TVX99036.1 hypothetical protein FPZ45_13850 [Cohnella terricola]